MSYAWRTQSLRNLAVDVFRYNSVMTVDKRLSKSVVKL